MPGLNLDFGSTDLETWRSGIWVSCTGSTVESETKPTRPCPKHGVETEWEECVLAARYPRDGEWGLIECGRCGEEFIELNSPNLAAWVCQGCGGEIIPRSKRVRFDKTNSAIETEQTALPISVTNGGTRE